MMRGDTQQACLYSPGLPRPTPAPVQMPSAAEIELIQALKERLAAAGHALPPQMVRASEQFPLS